MYYTLANPNDTTVSNTFRRRIEFSIDSCNNAENNHSSQ
jgi:hypothetical protein